jgi:predicted dehydrogenase
MTGGVTEDHGAALSAAAAIRKLVRFIAIHGPSRTWYKAAGRLRIPYGLPTLRKSTRRIGVIGCGQFAYATIAYFLQRSFGHCIAACYDVDANARASFARAMRVPRVCETAHELLGVPGLEAVYIASNHSSHADYAASVVRAGITAYVEKPVAVDFRQLVTLLAALKQGTGRIFAGYNRPFSAAIRLLRQQLRIVPDQGISLQCFVSGHMIGPDHWYRRPEEGTRVCGNIGHWLDLFVHVLAWRRLPDKLEISIAWADAEERDDNVSITITTDLHDLFTVMLTSRCEPFEGINETVDFQHGDTICKIDDFRSMTLWQGARRMRRRFWPKDVGHRLAIAQPFRDEQERDWDEVVLSTLLMLHIADMVRAGSRYSTYSFVEGRARVTRELEMQ